MASKALFEEELKKKIESEDYNFQGYYFPEEVDFLGLRFDNDVDFGGATFEKNADFRAATFMGFADFSEATFKKNAYFNQVIFQQNTSFTGATFKQNAVFTGSTFKKIANFNETLFQYHTDFLRTTFQEEAVFNDATFQEELTFNGSIFQDASFDNTKFEYVFFDKSRFQNASFVNAKFQSASFINAKFQNELNLQNAQFFLKGYFTTDLSKAKFHRAELRNVAFVDCDWPERIYEEVHASLSSRELETIYRNLKQNMQRSGDYSRAGKFYYREMEMRKKGATKIKDRVGLRVYKCLAGYGENYWNTALVSGFIILIFALFYGAFDCLQYSVGNPCLYQEVIDVVYFSFVTFTTLGLGDITPLTTLGKVLICFEAVTGAFMIALFVVVFVRKMAR